MDLLFIMFRHFNLWLENAYIKKQPVRYIGLQRHILGNVADWNPSCIEFFFSEEHGVIGIDGHPKQNAQVYLIFMFVCFAFVFISDY